MNVEENRLRTFSEWPADAAVDPARIAKAGFYYTGYALEVECFFCGTKIADWNYGDQVMARHRLAKPDCPFVIDSASTCNVPLIPASANGVESPTTLPNTQRSIINESNPDVTCLVRSTNPLRDYATTLQRLRSFNNWPLSFILPPEQMAKVGFYYLQYKDMVECVFCGGVLTNWKIGDDPDREHRLQFPNCDFYTRQDMEDDILELANVTLMPDATANLSELGIQTHAAPSSIRYATYEERLKTFVGWPKDHKQTPKMLAAAGFYYTGSCDQVRCFHCDGGLRNWEPKDDVWFEHARWFPTCTFLNLVRGQEFVKHCIDNRPPLDPKIFADVPEEDSENTTETKSLSTASPPESRPITDLTIVRLLDTAPALAALEIGLSVGRVKRALKRRLEEYGISYTNAKELIKDVLFDQTMEESTSSTPDPSFSESINLVDQVVQTTNNPTRSLNDIEDIDVISKLNRNYKNLILEKETQETDDTFTEEDEDCGKEDEIKEKKNIKKIEDKTGNITLQEENRRLKEARLCKICMDNEVVACSYRSGGKPLFIAPCEIRSVNRGRETPALFYRRFPVFFRERVDQSGS